MIVSSRLLALTTGLKEAHGKVTESRGKLWFYAYEGDTLQSNIPVLEFGEKLKSLITKKMGSLTIHRVESTGTVTTKIPNGITGISIFGDETEAVVELGEKLMDRGDL
jgi:hypothetical protein